MALPGRIHALVCKQRRFGCSEGAIRLQIMQDCINNVLTRLLHVYYTSSCVLLQRETSNRFLNSALISGIMFGFICLLKCALLDHLSCIFVFRQYLLFAKRLHVAFYIIIKCNEVRIRTFYVNREMANAQINQSRTFLPDTQLTYHSTLLQRSCVILSEF